MRGGDIDEAVAGLEQSDPQTRFELTEPQMRELGSDTAVIIYRFEGERAGSAYVAYMSSTYVREDAEWKLVLHQQTPVV